VAIAAVNELLTEVAGRCADGLILHGFTTRRYFDEVTHPALVRGMAASGRTDAVEVSYPLLIAAGSNGGEVDAVAAAVRERIAFYGSTPGYRGVLAVHGWEDVQSQLHDMARRGEWTAMGGLITDDMLDAFAVVGEWDELDAAVRRRVDGMAHRISFYAPYETDPLRWAELVRELQRSDR
jgi:probable F420-dependent oxidoreductase